MSGRGEVAGEGHEAERREPPSPPSPPGRRSLPALLAAWAEETPERPFLFYPDGLDMRWRSYRAVAAQAAAGSAALAALGLAAGERVAFAWRTGPDGVAADLAIQGADLTSVPLASAPPSAEAGGGDLAGAAAWLALPGRAAPEGMPSARLPEAASGRLRSGRGARGEPAPSWPSGPGAALVRDPQAAGGWRTEEPAALLAAARLLQERVRSCLAAVDPASLRRAPRREIALASFHPAQADGRALLAWVLLSGAALVLEPDPPSLGGVAAWTRPTLAAGPLRGVAALEEAARRAEAGRFSRWRRAFRRRGPRYPFGRLRTVVLLEPGRLGGASLSFWLERGVGVMRARGLASGTTEVRGQGRDEAPDRRP